jgi:hypothetical protein
MARVQQLARTSLRDAAASTEFSSAPGNGLPTEIPNNWQRRFRFGGVARIHTGRPSTVRSKGILVNLVEASTVPTGEVTFAASWVLTGFTVASTYYKCAAPQTEP